MNSCRVWLLNLILSVTGARGAVRWSVVAKAVPCSRVAGTGRRGDSSCSGKPRSPPQILGGRFGEMQGRRHFLPARGVSHRGVPCAGGRARCRHRRAPTASWRSLRCEPPHAGLARRARSCRLVAPTRYPPSCPPLSLSRDPAHISDLMAAAGRENLGKWVMSLAHLLLPCFAPSRTASATSSISSAAITTSA